MTILSLFQKGLINHHQYDRVIKFIETQQKWMLSEHDPDHPMIKEEITNQVLKRIDIYLWCVDPIISRSPHTINQMARLWLEKKVYDMDPDDAAIFIASWVDLE